MWGNFRLSSVLCFFTAFLLFGCQSPYSPEREAAQRLAAAENYLDEKKYRYAFTAVDEDVDSYGETGQRARELLADDSDFATGVVEEYLREIENLDSPAYAIQLKKQIDTLEKAQQISESAEKTHLVSYSSVLEMRQKLNLAVSDGNKSGKIPFMLDDEIVSFAGLTETPDIDIIFERTLAELRAGTTTGNNTVRGNLAATIEFVKQRGPSSPYYEALRSALLEIRLTRSQLETIRVLFPDYADQAIRAMTVTVYLTTNPERPLIKEDVGSALKREEDILLVEQDESGAVTVEIRELQFDQRQMPDNTRQVVVGYYDVNPFVAALTLPSGASVLYDVREGGAEIEWAVELVLTRGHQQIGKKLLRGRESDSYHQCMNLRVQNVFGGVSSATTWPNEETQKFCQRGGTPITLSTLRLRIMGEIAGEIKALLPSSSS